MTSGRDDLIDNPLSPKWGIATSGLDAAELKFLHARLKPVSFAPRQHLFFENMPATDIYVIRQGRVRLYQARADGQEFSYGIFFNGTILNLAAFVLDRPCVLSGEALETVTAAAMSRADFRACLDMSPRFQHNVMQLLAILALDSIGKNVPMALDSADMRLGRTLLDLAKPERGWNSHMQGDGGRLVARVSQEELGRLTGVSRNWVGRTLAAFERAGLITRTRGALSIPDPQKMRSFIEAETAGGS